MFLRAKKVRAQGRRRGIAAVEFAFIIPIFITLILGMIEFGRAIMVMDLLANAARNGARTGALPGNTNTSVQDAVDQTLNSTGVSGATTTILVNNAAGQVSTAAIGDSITVQVTVPYTTVAWLPTTIYLGEGATLKGRMTIRKE
jgi:Flp pilus assembly protein TadG